VDRPRDERDRDRGEAPSHAPRPDDEEPGRRALDRPLEAHEDGGGSAPERPRRRVAEIDRDQLERATLDEDIRGAPRGGQPAAAADPEESAERDPKHRRRGRVEAVRSVDERRPGPARRDARERTEEHPGASGGARADQFRELTPREASVEERVERREPRGDPSSRRKAGAGPNEERGHGGVV
jgi:hypothetical protein